MKKNVISCEQMKLKVMALIDNELTVKEIERIKKHLQECEKCQKEYKQLIKTREITREMKLKKLPEMYWEEYWQHIYNRIERGISWILISIGAIIVLFFAAWQLVSKLIADQSLNPFFKAGILILVAGFVILFISIVREKLMIRRVDKYKEIER